jgi:hypothetical protein
MKALNKSPGMGIGPTAAFWLWGFLIGIYALSLYAAIRPHFGPSPKTAVIAGIGVWVPASLLSMIAPAALHLFRYRLIAIGVVLGFVEIVVGTVVGAWLYKEQDVPRGVSATPAGPSRPALRTLGTPPGGSTPSWRSGARLDVGWQPGRR